MRHFVNNALLFGNSSAPVARVVSLQRFGFTQAFRSDDLSEHSFNRLTQKKRNKI